MVDRTPNPIVGLIVRRFAGHDRDAGGLHQTARFDLRSHLRDDARRRADKCQPGPLAGGSELGIFGEEPVSGMNGVGAAVLRGIQNARDRKIATGGRRGSDRHGTVGGGRMWSVSVGVGIHSDAFDRELATRARNAQRNLAAVRDEDAFNHASKLFTTEDSGGDLSHSMMAFASPGTPSSLPAPHAKRGGQRSFWP